MDKADSPKLASKYERFLKFAVVGVSGIFVNMVLFWVGSTLIFHELGNSERIIASTVLAVALSILSNFLLNDMWTWRDRRNPGSTAFFKRMFKYFLVASVAGLIQIIVTWSLIVPLEINYHILQTMDWIGKGFGATVVGFVGSAPGEPLANLAGIATATVVNFVFNNLWTFKQKPDALETSTSVAEDSDGPSVNATLP